MSSQPLSIEASRIENTPEVIDGFRPIVDDNDVQIRLLQDSRDAMWVRSTVPQNIAAV